MVAHFPLTRLADECRRAGLTVDIAPGAQGRAARMFAPNGYSQGCQSSVVHHTASSGANPQNEINYILAANGDPGYVIANAYTALDGKITLIASGPTYTEGTGGPLGIIPANGGNTVSFSNEVAGGLGADFTPEQCHSVLVFHAIVNRIAAEVWAWGGDPFAYYRLFGHFEWTTRKIDPMGGSPWATGYTKWDMHSFRADAAGVAAPPEEGSMTAIDPIRWINTRTNNAPLKARKVRRFQVPGLLAFRPALFVNLTVVPQGEAGWLVAWSEGEPPSASNVNFTEKGAIANTALVRVDSQGYMRFMANQDCHLVVDIQGYG